MERPFPSSSYSHHCVEYIINFLFQNVFDKVTEQQLNLLIAREMPRGHLKYISSVSVMLHSHREPASNQRIHPKLITEPSQSISHQTHNLLIRKVNKVERFEEDVPTIRSKQNTRKQSICLTVRSRLSASRVASRKNLNSRRKIQNNFLIPLNRATICQDSNDIYEQKIAQLRKRKIKLEQAMKAFRQEAKVDKIIIKNKQNDLQFTTDFKGKIINFNPKSAKVKINDSLPFVVRQQTTVQSGRSWENCGKVSSNTRRNLFVRDNSNEYGVHEVEL